MNKRSPRDQSCSCVYCGQGGCRWRGCICEVNSKAGCFLIWQEEKQQGQWESTRAQAAGEGGAHQESSPNHWVLSSPAYRSPIWQQARWLLPGQRTMESKPKPQRAQAVQRQGHQCHMFPREQRPAQNCHTKHVSQRPSMKLLNLWEIIT